MIDIPIALLTDAFNRIGEVVHEATVGLSEDQLGFRPGKDANSIAWLVWHLTRIQDDHISELAGTEQAWVVSGWHKKFGLPFDIGATGFGQTSEEVAAVKASAAQLTGYYDDVQAGTLAFLRTLTPEDYDRVVDRSWDPPVTLAVRLVSVISDDLQHAGQAAYVRGLLK